MENTGKVDDLHNPRADMPHIGRRDAIERDTLFLQRLMYRGPIRFRERSNGIRLTPRPNLMQNALQLIDAQLELFVFA